MRNLVLCLALVVTWPAIGAAVQMESTSEPSVIIVAGHATRSISPDGVAIRLQVAMTRESAAEVAEAVGSTANAVVRAVEAVGVSDLTVSRIGYGIGVNYERRSGGEVRFNGYAGRMTILVETTDLDATGRLVEAGIAAGANQLQGISYTSTAMHEARRTALREAVEAARLDAEAMAEAAGGTLGRLLLLTTERAPGPSGVQLEALSVSPARGTTQITPEDLTVGARVESRWLFNPDSTAP